MKIILKIVGDYSGNTYECTLEEFLSDLDPSDDEADNIAAVKALKVGETTNTGLFTVTRTK
jgi:hypothetical protein